MMKTALMHVLEKSLTSKQLIHGMTSRIALTELMHQNVMMNGF